MREMLSTIMLKEAKAIEDLLALLEHQHSCIAKRDIYGMEACVAKITEANKQLALLEVERRKIVGDQGMSVVVAKLEDQEVEAQLRHIQKLLHAVQLQKETNDLLIRQGLSYVNRMLTIFNPGSTSKTYNATGKMMR